MRAILNGVELKDPLLLKTLVIKMVTVPLVLGAGMCMGKTDMFIGAAVANQLLRLPIFKNLRENTTLKHQMIACGLAHGVVCSNFAFYSVSSRHPILVLLLVVCYSQWKLLAPIIR